MIWYGHHHLVLVIFISEAPSWSPSSPARHLDLHRSIVVVSPIFMLPRLSLPFSNKVKHLHRDCIAYNKATTIWLLPVANNSVTKHDHLIQSNLASCLDHITSQHALQKQVRRPLLCCCMFYVAAMGFSKNQSYLRIKTTTIVCQVGAVLTFARTLFIESGSTKARETDTH